MKIMFEALLDAYENRTEAWTTLEEMGREEPQQKNFAF